LAEEKSVIFPKVLLGTASAAYQVEGAVREDGAANRFGIASRTRREKSKMTVRGYGLRFLSSLSRRYWLDKMIFEQPSLFDCVVTDFAFGNGAGEFEGIGFLQARDR